MAIFWGSLTAIALAVAAAVWWSWWRLPQRQVAWLPIQIDDPKARADTEDNFRKTIGQALGGAAVLIGAGFALFQFLEQQKASHDLLISNQFSKGFEQLASNDIAIRVGGLYALSGAMSASDPRYHPEYFEPVIETLKTFLRGRAGRPYSGRKSTDDILAALLVIQDWRRSHNVDVDLSGLDLAGYNLRKAKLFRVNLSGADLRGADLSSADLRGAKLDGQHQLDGACGIDATLPEGLTLKPCPDGPVAPPLNQRAPP